jgi:hypothetical protein
MEKLLRLGAKLPVIKTWCLHQLHLIHQRRLENELAAALSEEIRKEIDAEIIQKILATVNAQAGATTEGKYGKSI